MALGDLATDLPTDEVRERAMIQELISQLRRLRRSAQMSKAEILLVAI
ncbi:MAG: hypothetical protein M5U15_01455 [Kiritimatiellae bacterium]|nr:hypothetical protein [Kiritimatiellia bacterium]